MRRVVAEHVAVLVHEGVEVRLLAAHALDQHVVEVAQHLLHALDVALGHLVDHLRDILEERLGHGLLELLEQLLEFVSRLLVEELVALQRLDLARRLLGHLFEELLLALDDAAQHLGEVLLLGGAALAATGLRGRAARHLAALLLC